MLNNNSPKTKISGSMWTKESNPSESNLPVTKTGLLKKGNSKLFPNKVKVLSRFFSV
jgi:hypothetical protein